MRGLYIIDRIEGDDVYLETPEGTIARMPVSALPGGASEGDILVKDGDEYIIDHETTDARRAELERRLKRLTERR